jgi:2-amino-4-hydroxy-6-hydroxymethyldihydropteridine diphosphokinase
MVHQRVRQEQISAFIGLGSNSGDVRSNLAEAVRALAGLEGLEVERASSVYSTQPQGVTDQPWFGNQVLRARCDGAIWGARNLLLRMLRIESEMGRVRQVCWGQRIIDLDLLLFGNEESADPELILPHPRMRERAFVLVPLLEIEPEMRLPDGQRLADCLAGLAYSLEGCRIRQEERDSVRPER